MSDTQELLQRIGALRRRLEQARGNDRQPGESGLVADTVQTLERKVQDGARENALLDGCLRVDSEPKQAEEMVGPLPPKLTARASWILRRGRELLQQLRDLVQDALEKEANLDPLAVLYRETCSLLETLPRTIQVVPTLPSVQARACDGLEVVLGVVQERLAILKAGLRQRRIENGRLEELTGLLSALVAGQTVGWKEFMPLAEGLLEDAAEGLPLRFYAGPTDHPVRFAAAHGLSVAQVMARLIHQDQVWKNREHEPVLAGLVHDVGMGRVPGDILSQPGPLNDLQRRLVESHPRFGAALIRRLGGGLPWLEEAAGNHHERMDGTGYPAGMSEVQLSPLVRLLSVCDVYAALCAPRPYRPALDTRTALTDTLLLADQGALDRNLTERLLNLSFYPVGSVVELTDGAMGVVVATQRGGRDLRAPAKPVVALVADPQGQPPPAPRHVNLADDQERSVLRALSLEERFQLLARRYPSLAA